MPQIILPPKEQQGKVRPLWVGEPLNLPPAGQRLVISERIPSPTDVKRFGPTPPPTGPPLTPPTPEAIQAPTAPISPPEQPPLGQPYRFEPMLDVGGFAPADDKYIPPEPTGTISKRPRPLPPPDWSKQDLARIAALDQGNALKFSLLTAGLSPENIKTAQEATSYAAAGALEGIPYIGPALFSNLLPEPKTKLARLSKVAGGAISFIATATVLKRLAFPVFVSNAFINTPGSFEEKEKAAAETAIILYAFGKAGQLGKAAREHYGTTVFRREAIRTFEGLGMGGAITGLNVIFGAPLDEAATEGLVFAIAPQFLSRNWGRKPIGARLSKTTKDAVIKEIADAAIESRPLHWKQLEKFIQRDIPKPVKEPEFIEGVPKTVRGVTLPPPAKRRFAEQVEEITREETERVFREFVEKERKSPAVLKEVIEPTEAAKPGLALGKRKVDQLQKRTEEELRKMADILPEAQLKGMVAPKPEAERKPRIEISELTKPEQLLFAQEQEMPLYKGGIPMMGEKPAAPFIARGEGETRRPENLLQWLAKEGGIKGKEVRVEGKISYTGTDEFSPILERYHGKTNIIREKGMNPDAFADAMFEQFRERFSGIDPKDNRGMLQRSMEILGGAIEDPRYSREIVRGETTRQRLLREREEVRFDEETFLKWSADEIARVEKGKPTEKDSGYAELLKQVAAGDKEFWGTLGAGKAGFPVMAQIPLKEKPSAPIPPAIIPRAEVISKPKPEVRLEFLPGLTLYQDIFNRFAAIEYAGVAARKLGVKVPPGLDAQWRSRTYLGLIPKFQEVLENKTFRMTLEGNVEITGEGLKPIFRDYETASLERNMKRRETDWDKYLENTRIVEDLQRPKGYWTEEKIATPEQTRKAHAALSELTKKYGSLEIFEPVSERLYAFERRILHLLVDSGHKTEVEYQRMVAANPHYIPFHRIISEIEPQIEPAPKTRKPFTAAAAGLKRIRGGEQEIYPPLESLIRNTFRILDVTERNMVARSVANLKSVFPQNIVEVKAPIVPVGQIDLKAHIDPKMKSDIIEMIKSLGGEYERKLKIGGKRLGYFAEPNKIVTRFATQESVDAHELGHFLDLLYGLGPKLTQRGATAKELRVLADLRGVRKKYARKSGEKIAALIDAYITKPFILDAVAPQSKQVVDELIRANPKLAPLSRIRASMMAADERIRQTIFGPSPYDPPGNIVKYWEEGKRKYVEVPREIFQAMAGLNQTSMGLVTKILSIPAHALRIGATITPEFMARNITKDQWVSFIQNTVGYRPGVDAVRALGDIIGKTDIYHEWMMSGGAYSTLQELNRRGVSRIIRDLRRDPSIWRKINIISSAQDISQMFEQSTKVGGYKAAKRIGLPGIEAAFKSREISVDWAPKGARMKEITSVIAFFGAGLNALNRMGRAFKNNPFKTTAKCVAGITIPSVLLYLRNREDPDYEEISRVLRDIAWITKMPEGVPVLGGKYVGIPKPFAYGQIFGSAVERFMEYVDRKDPRALNGLAKSLMDSLLPVQGDPSAMILPTGIKPLIENITNWSFFKERAVFPQYLEGRLPFQQQTKYNSEFTKRIGRILNKSPAKIENWVRGYFGGTGKYALDLTDLGVRTFTALMGGVRDEKMPAELADYPLFRGFMIRSPEAYPESLDVFYREARQISAAHGSWQDAKRGQRPDEADYIINKYPKLVLHPAVTAIKYKISKINRAIQLVEDDPNTEGKIKAQQVRNLERQRMDLSRIGNKIISTTELTQPEGELIRATENWESGP